MFIDSGWFVQFHTSYVKMINTREELLVKSLNIYLKTVYHADSYNACSTWSYPLQKSYIYSVISVYFDFWSTLVSKIVSKSSQHCARSQLKISKDISHSWNRNKYESGSKVYKYMLKYYNLKIAVRYFSGMKGCVSLWTIYCAIR